MPIHHVDDYRCEFDELLPWCTELVSDGVVHVYPLNDLRAHILHNECPCKPTLKPYGIDSVIVHNSYDGREAWEPIVKPSRFTRPN